MAKCEAYVKSDFILKMFGMMFIQEFMCFLNWLT
uniref:Uncharacterized protein n=1 Tax=Arundo donax TaxID=35708 RepID=A0A0A9A7V8_ARUDO